MTTWSNAKQMYKEAPRIVQLPPNCFADDWPNKPTETMECGLKLISEGDIEKARISALEWAQSTIKESVEDRIDSYNDAIMRMILARATCMPNNVMEPFFTLPEENFRDALTVDAVKLLWHEYDVLKTESCNYISEADEDDLAELSLLLMDQDAWEKLPVAKFKRLRRLAKHVLEELDPELRF